MASDLTGMPFYLEKIGIASDKTASISKVTRGQTGHATIYDIESDEEVDGVRTIKLKVKDIKETERKIKEIIQVMCGQLKEPSSKALRQILKDRLNDYWPAYIDQLYEDVVVRKEPVKAREGCFKLIVGDGRLKGHHEIMLRE